MRNRFLLLFIRPALLSALVLGLIAADGSDPSPSHDSMHLRIRPMSVLRPNQASRFWVGLQNEASYPMQLLLDEVALAAGRDTGAFDLELPGQGLLVIEQGKISAEYAADDEVIDDDGGRRLVELHPGEGIGRVLKLADGYQAEIFVPDEGITSAQVIASFSAFDEVALWCRYPRSFDDGYKSPTGQMVWAQPATLALNAEGQALSWAADGVTVPFYRAAVQERIQAIVLHDASPSGKAALLMALRNVSKRLLWIDQDDLQSATVLVNGVPLGQTRIQTDRAYVPLWPGEALSLNVPLETMPGQVSVEIHGTYRLTRFANNGHEYRLKLIIESGE